MLKEFPLEVFLLLQLLVPPALALVDPLVLVSLSQVFETIVERDDLIELHAPVGVVQDLQLDPFGQVSRVSRRADFRDEVSELGEFTPQHFSSNECFMHTSKPCTQLAPHL